MLLFMLLPALNLVNLNTGRIMERSTEIGVRKAFGATSMQLAGQLVVENVLLCLAGGLIGLACPAVLWWPGDGPADSLPEGRRQPRRVRPAACCSPSCSACSPA
jgi:cell division protein FtsX